MECFRFRRYFGVLGGVGMHILLVEDDEAILEGLAFCLKKEDFQVNCAHNGNEALNIFSVNDFDLLILDIGLPDIQGIKLYKMLKEIKDVPTIFLTANDSELSVVEALDSGADDYVTKPFKTRELISRIRSVLRRVKKEEDVIRIHDITIYPKEAKVFKKDKLVFLTALEYKILLILCMNPGKVFTRESILAQIWDTEEEYVNDNTLTVYIKRIREKIEDDPTEPKIIFTVRGLGYQANEK